jgi:DNA-binding MarR family transcriptional regulator
MKRSDFDPQQQNQSLESRIIAALERISQAFRILSWQESKQHGLTPVQIQALIFLLFHKEEERTLSDMACELGVTKATLSEVITTLEQKELVSRKVSSDDARSFILHLTSQGRMLATKTSLLSTVLREPVMKFTSAEKENLLNSLLAIIRYLNEKGIITRQRMCFSCRFFEWHRSGGAFCHLMQKPLKKTDLRLNCPEHEPLVEPPGS